MEFDIGRLRHSHRLMGGGGVALFIFMFFLKWFGGSSSGAGVNYSATANGWHTFTNSRWIWLITIIVSIGLVVFVAGQRKLSSPVSPSAIVAGLGALSTLLILYRIIHHPSGGVSGTIAGVHYSSSYGIKIGIWLGLIAAAAITYGGYLAMREEGTSISDVREQASRAVGNFTETVSHEQAEEPTTPVPAPEAPSEFTAHPATEPHAPFRMPRRDRSRRGSACGASGAPTTERARAWPDGKRDVSRARPHRQDRRARLGGCPTDNPCGRAQRRTQRRHPKTLTAERSRARTGTRGEH
jgi:hypothetical protein